LLLDIDSTAAIVSSLARLVKQYVPGDRSRML
jgi:hypothetical protein